MMYKSPLKLTAALCALFLFGACGGDDADTSTTTPKDMATSVDQSSMTDMSVAKEDMSSANKDMNIMPDLNKPEDMSMKVDMSPEDDMRQEIDMSAEADMRQEVDMAPPMLCLENERVFQNKCEPCTTGATRPPGDDPTGPNTECLDDCTALLGVSCATFEQGYFKASNAEAGDGFGTSIAISGDTMVVGARGEASSTGGNPQDNRSQASGAAYVFVKDTQGVWTQQAYLKASDVASRNQFGTSVAIDGDTIAVGAPRRQVRGTLNAGAVYVFTRTGSKWTEETIVPHPSPDAGDYFGQAIALEKDTLVVGAINEDSNAKGIDGDQSNNDLGDSGAVFVFTRNAGSWVKTAYLKASNTHEGALFGWSLAIDAGRILVGSLRERGLAREVNGDETNIGVADTGAAYLFVQGPAGWTQTTYFKSSVGRANTSFGVSVALSGDLMAVGSSLDLQRFAGIKQMGGPMVVGNKGGADSGAVYAYKKIGATWVEQAIIKASNSAQSQQFGGQVDLKGTRLLVSAAGDRATSRGLNQGQTAGKSRSGGMFIFDYDGALWSQTGYIKPLGSSDEDLYGVRIALSDKFAAMGSPRDDSGAAKPWDPADNSAVDSGAVYLFQVSP